MRLALLRIIAEQPLAFGRDGASSSSSCAAWLIADSGLRTSCAIDAVSRPSAASLICCASDLRAAEVLEIDQRAAVQPGADAHEPHAQQPLRRLDLERRQRFGEVLAPAPPVVVQRGRELDEPHAAAHAPEAAQQPRDLRVVAAHDAVQVDDQHAVLHVLDDQPVHLLEIGDVDAALRRELFRQLGVAAERDRDADRREVAEADEARLEQLRAADDLPSTTR